MSDTTTIEWTDATINFWWGCTAVGPGCDHCYAEAWAKRLGHDLWGNTAPRRWIEGAAVSLRRLNRGHDRFFARHGRRRRVFMQSMSDLFDNEVARDWRMSAFAEAELATNLDIQFLTKRVSNVVKFVPAHWPLGRWPRHIGLMITVVNQDEADRDIPRLLRLKEECAIPWIGLSIEPMLGPIDLRYLKRPNAGFGPYWLDALSGQAGWFADESATQITNDDAVHDGYGTIDWVIVGGESGLHARPIMRTDWVRSIRDQCEETATPFLFKQWGDWAEWPVLASGFKNCSRFDRLGNVTQPRARLHPPYRNGFVMPEGDVPWHGEFMRVGKKAAGRMLDERTHDDFWRAAA